MPLNDLLLAVMNTALIAIAVGVYRIKSIPGPQGPRGEAGPVGPQGQKGEDGPAGHLHTVAVTGGPHQRFEMLRDGQSTAHFVKEGSPDFDEAINTPGLSLRTPDGAVIEGVQNGR